MQKHMNIRNYQEGGDITFKMLFDNVEETHHRALGPSQVPKFSLGLEEKGALPGKERYIIDEQSLSDLKRQRHKGEPDARLRTDTSADTRGSYIISLLMTLYIL